MITRYCAVVFMVAVLSACASPKIHTTIIVPAGHHEATTLRQVAVVPFSGESGAGFAAEVEGALSTVRISDKPFYQLVERSKLDQVVKEMQLSLNGLIDESTAVKIGNIIGAKGIYTGTVKPFVHDTAYKEQRRRCAYTTTKKDKKGRSYEECASWENFNVNCTKRDARFAFTPKLVNVETGVILYANNLEGTASDSTCSDSQKPIATKNELLAKAKSSALSRFLGDVAPQYRSISLNLMEAKGIKTGEADTRFDQGMQYALNNRLERACELWKEAFDSSPESPSILYNLGICAEVAGNTDMALSYYRKADQQLGEPHKDITAALDRMKRQKTQSDKLSRQLGQ